MKWRECRNREMWYTGPEEGDTYWIARKGGVHYEVRASWRNPLARSGGVVWWLHYIGPDGAVNKAYRTKDAAINAAEQAALTLGGVK